jgi:hypothetical protein
MGFEVLAEEDGSAPHALRCLPKKAKRRVHARSTVAWSCPPCPSFARRALPPSVAFMNAWPTPG